MNNIKKEEVLIWDDSLQNVEAAKTFGFESKYFSNNANFTEEMKSIFKFF